MELPEPSSVDEFAELGTLSMHEHVVENEPATGDGPLVVSQAPSMAERSVETEIVSIEDEPVSGLEQSVELPVFETELIPEQEQVSPEHVPVELTPFPSQITVETPPLEAPSATEMLAELEEPNLQLLQETLPFLVFEAHDAYDAEEVAEQPTIVEQLAVYIETLEPAEAEEAGTILEVIMDKIELLTETFSEEEAQILELELEVICARMLICMGIEPTPEITKNLILALRKEYLMQLEMMQTEEIDEGTHERKHDFGQMFYDLPDAVHPLTSILGRVTLLLAV